MSRLANVSNLAFVPTQEGIIPLILRHIQVEDKCSNHGVVLDPCVGDGRPLKELVDGLNQKFNSHAAHAHLREEYAWIYNPHRHSYGHKRVAVEITGEWQGYGVELDEQRAAQAATLLGRDKVLCSPIEQVAVPKDGADILFLNPPYDAVGGKRVEIRFLRETTPFLRSGGLLIYVIPETLLTSQTHRADLAAVIRESYRDVQVFRYPQEVYEQYHQVVLFAVRSSRGDSIMNLEAKHTLGEVVHHSNRWKCKGFVRSISAGATHLDLIKTNIVPVSSPFANPEFLDSLTWWLGDPQKSAASMRPLLPMGPPHGAMVAAAGAINGLELNTSAGVRVVRGSTFKVKVKDQQTERAADGRKVEVVVEAERFVSRIAILGMEGVGKGLVTVCDSHNSPVLFDNVLIKNASAFVATAEKLFPVICTPERLAPWLAEIEKQVHAPRVIKGEENGLWPAQADRAAALLVALNEERVKVTTLDGQMGTGKAQPLDAKVLTPSGWKLMGNITVGDKVVGSNGKPTKVVGVFPQGKKDIYRVTMTDGATTECTDDHLWTVNSPGRINRGSPWRTKPLSFIRGYMAHANGNLQNLIPMVQPVEFRNEGDRPVDPYLLGMLLGDGCLSSPRTVYFSSVDNELLDSVRRLLPEGVILKWADRCNYRITKPQRKGGKPNPLLDKLRSLELMGKRSETKFVPDAYKFASSKVRLAVLQGLADTDGYIGKSMASVEYVTVSPQLADDVMFLVQSLGGRATIRTKETGYQLAYRIFFRLPEGMQPFRLTRKAEVYPLSCLCPATRRFKTVKHVGVKEAQCIMVEAEDGLYVTDDFIVTHNTLIAMAVSSLTAIQRKPGSRVVVVMMPPKDDLLLKWEEEIKRSLRDFNPVVYKIGVKGYTVEKSLLHRTREKALHARLTEDIARLESEIPNADSPTRLALKAKLTKTKKQLKGLKAKMRKDTFKTKRPLWEIDQAFKEEGLTFILMKSTTAKLGGGWEDVPLPMRTVYHELLSHFEKPTRETLRNMAKRHKSPADLKVTHAKGLWKVHIQKQAPYCPICGKEIDPEELLSGSKRQCPHCEGKLYTHRANPNGGQDRMPLAKYIRERYARRFFFILDECHGSMQAVTAIGNASTDLMSACSKAIQMTGTLFGGKASSLFHILYRANHEFRGMYAFNETQKFIDAYGLMQKVTKTYPPAYGGTTYSGYKTYTSSPSEIPGCAPGMAMLLLPQTGFLSMSDLAISLPTYEEHTLFVEPCKDLFLSVIQFLAKVRKEAIEAWKDGDSSLLGKFRMARIAVMNRPLFPEVIGENRYEPPAVGKNWISKKEEALLRLLWGEKQKGRKVMVFVGQINARDPTPRLLELLTQHGLKGAVLRTNIKRRVEWINGQLAGGADAIFCSPQLVSEGIDLTMINTGIWYSIEYNTYVVPQANRRFLRPGSTKPVKIYYLAFDRFHPAVAMKCIAEKLAAQQALRGDIRAGIARLLGQETFVSRLQDATLENEYVPQESDLTMADLGPMPSRFQAAKLVVPTITMKEWLAKRGLKDRKEAVKRTHRHKGQPKAQLALF